MQSPLDHPFPWPPVPREHSFSAPATFSLDSRDNTSPHFNSANHIIHHTASSVSTDTASLSTLQGIELPNARRLRWQIAGARAMRALGLTDDNMEMEAATPFSALTR